jgi:hypothetical protein
MISFQILYGLFFIITIVKTFREKPLKPYLALCWLLLVFVGAVAVFFPKITVVFAKLLGVGRGSDLIIYLSTVLIFYLLYRLYLKIEKLSSRIDILIRKSSRIKRN